ncbi:MAG TPA: hypothetical protein VLT79_12540 [Gemmatimonadales bacterium]|nr:hypothetical protein [Gemmatimonadales bacterium]
MIGQVSHPCARCGTPTEGIAVGGLCAACTNQRDRKAARLGRLAALVSTLVLASSLLIRLRSVAPAWLERARLVSAVAVIAWYWLTYRIVSRVAREWC